MDYKSKYLKYKNKYNTLKNIIGGTVYKDSITTYIPELASTSDTPIIRGLPNVGNTCFVNAVFLLLGSIKGFFPRLQLIKDYPQFQRDTTLFLPFELDKATQQVTDRKSSFITRNTNILIELIAYLKAPTLIMENNEVRNKLRRIFLERYNVCVYHSGSGGESLSALQSIIDKLKLYHILKDLLYFNEKTTQNCNKEIDPVNFDKKGNRGELTLVKNLEGYILNLSVNEIDEFRPEENNINNIISNYLSKKSGSYENCYPNQMDSEIEITNNHNYILINMQRTTLDPRADTSRQNFIPINTFNNININSRIYKLLGVIIQVESQYTGGVNHFVYFYNPSPNQFIIFDDNKTNIFRSINDIVTIHGATKSIYDFISYNGILFLYESDDSSTLGATIPVDVSRSTNSQSEIIRKIGKLEEFLKNPELDKGFRTMKENQLEYLKSKLGDISRSPLSQTTTTQPIADIVSPQKLRKPNPTIINLVDPKNDIPTQIKDITDKIQRIRVFILNNDKYDPEFIINEERTLEILKNNLLMLKKI
jgi:hypothetical protein